MSKLLFTLMISVVILSAQENEMTEQTVDDKSVEADTLGILQVKTVPDSARLIFNGKEIGVTPFRIDNIKPGKHTLILKKSGHFVKKVSVNVKAGSNSEVEIKLSKPSTLVVNSQPEGAVVSLNGKMVGQTPYIDRKLKPQKYEITLQKSGFPVIDTVINLENNKADTLNFTLVEENTKKDEIKSTADEIINDAGEDEEKSKLSKVMNKVAIGIFAAFTAIILFIELNQNK